MGFALFAEVFRGSVKGAECPRYFLLASPKQFPFAGMRRGVRRLHRAEAAIAAAPEGRANRTASGVRHRPEAGHALDHHADRAAPLALDANAVRRNRGLAP